MKINSIKPSSYSEVESAYLAAYIKQYANKINATLEDVTITKLSGKNRTELKNIVAELETVQKRLDWILKGMY